MHRSRSAAWVMAGVTALSLSLSAAPASAEPQSQHHGTGRGHDYTFAVIGDIPYGQAEIQQFPRVVAQLNADPNVRLVAHLGDIKDGSSVCSDQYFSLIKSDFDRFVDPLVYTIGDNEWTDCHRPSNGSYNPLERLAAVRRTFFAEPGLTLGQHQARVRSDADHGYPENVRFSRDRVSFASVHIVGSNNSLAPWTGQTAPTPAQTAEVLGRTASVIATMRDAFATAKARHDRAVVLLTQADMFDPTVPNPSFSDYYAFQPIVAALAEEAAAFGRPVYLFNGDSHVYHSDQPLAAGSNWLNFYQVSTPVPNLQRITVDGSKNAHDYLKVTISANRRAPLTWTRVPFTS